MLRKQTLNTKKLCNWFYQSSFVLFAKNSQKITDLRKWRTKKTQSSDSEEKMVPSDFWGIPTIRCTVTAFRIRSVICLSLQSPCRNPSTRWRLQSNHIPPNLQDCFPSLSGLNLSLCSGSHWSLFLKSQKRKAWVGQTMHIIQVLMIFLPISRPAEYIHIIFTAERRGICW